MSTRRERRELSRHKQKWLAAVRKSDLPEDTKLFEERLAASTAVDGSITDSEIIAALREIDAERS